MGNEVPKLIADRDIERPCDQAQTLSAVERALWYHQQRCTYGQTRGTARCSEQQVVSVIRLLHVVA